MEYPPVSVVMPVRNEERHLAESVRHVLGQDIAAAGQDVGVLHHVGQLTDVALPFVL